MEVLPITTSVTKSGPHRITKGIDTLVIFTSVDPNDLTNEKINIQVENPNGTNQEITRGGFMSLKDFIIMGTADQDAVTVEPSNSCFTALCELTRDDRGIVVPEKGAIIVEFSGLVTTRSYGLLALENPLSSAEPLEVETKVMSADESNQTFTTDEYDFAIMQDSSSISEIAMTVETTAGSVVMKYSPIELRAVSRSTDVCKVISATGAIRTAYTDKLVLPLIGVSKIEIRKSPGTRLDFTFRKSSFETTV